MAEVTNRWQRFWLYSQRIVHNNSGFITAFTVINFTTMEWELFRQEDYLSMLGYAFSMLLVSFLLVQLLELIRCRLVKRLIKTALLVGCGLVFGLEFFTMYTYSALVGAGILNSLIETNVREASEFLLSHVGIKELVGLASLACGVLFVRRSLKACKQRQPISCRMLQYSLVLGIVGLAELGWLNYGVLADNFFPLQRVSSAAAVTADNIQAYHELAAQLESDIVLTRNDSRIKNVVLVIGESCNRNHMGLYGYYLPNTPNLSRMKADGDIYVFNDVVSPHSTTIAVLSKLLTFCDYESPQEWYHYNNLIDVMNTAGYKTFWLSNQESSGIWGGVAQLFAERSSEHEFTRIRDSREDYGILDEELFPLIERAKEQRGDKNFFVIHLMGQHDLYYNRYPYTFHKFTENDIRLDVDDKARLTVAQYDNSILYNDYIVTQIIDRFKADETLLVYVSDHGEAVYDGNDFNGHVEENPNRHMIEIPCIMWASDKLRAKEPEKLAQLAGAVERPYMTDDMIHTLLDLLDIETAEYQPQKSIVNGCFDAARHRIYNGIDYDEEIKTGLACE